MISSEKKPIHILHFNDVYEIRENPKSQVCGGADRFATVLKDYKEQEPLILFSGDLWSPSKLTSVFKGEHLVDIMNALKIDAAALGNHDLVSYSNLICANTIGSG